MPNTTVPTHATSKTDRPFKYGDVHPTAEGLTFVGYKSGSLKLIWETAETKARRLEKQLALAKAKYHSKPDAPAPVGDARVYKYGDAHPTKPGYTFYGYRAKTAAPCWESEGSRTKRLAKAAAYATKKDREAGVPERRVGRDMEAYKAYQAEFRKTPEWYAAQKKWYEANKEAKFAKKIERKKSDPLFRLRVWAGNQNQRLKQYMLCGVTPRKGSMERLGCTPAHLKAHLESKFTDGMSWENCGKWHIDHVVPLASAKTEEQVYVLCKWTNLQPLWAEDNLRKSDQLHP